MTAMPHPAPPPLSSHHLRLPFLFFPPPAARRPLRRGDLAIRMGGGPRTYPGGVSKWQWKRMQARKAKQLLKARLSRERQLYEMRKRAELRDAVAHLERPWDPDAADTRPNLLSVAADDQLKALADRFHRPGGVDLWNDRDGPQVFASPDTGRASARFFPKNAIHSVQPYALLGAGGERSQDGSGSGNGKRAQGARENAAVEDVCGDREPTVQFMERDGTWEPVNALDGGDENNANDWSWNDDDDDDVISDSENTGDVGLGRDGRAMVRRHGRKGGVARWQVANVMAVGSDEDRDWGGHGFFSDSGGEREGDLEQRLSERRSSGGRRKRPTGRWKAGGNAIGKDRMGGGSFSDSEVIGGGFEPKWRARSRVNTMNGAGRWKVSYDGNGNVIRKEWTEDEFDSNSDGGRDVKLEPKRKTRNRFDPSENRRLRPGLGYDNAHANNGDRPRRYTRGNNGDGRDWFGNGFASDLEEPTWKPRRSGARKSNSRRAYSGNMSGKFGRGGDGSARGLEANPINNYRENGSEGGRRRMSRNGGRRFREDGYSLRPASELHSSGRAKE